MPDDLICPPLWTLDEPCPCRPVRVGAALLTMSVYSAVFAPVFFDKPFATVAGHLVRGDIPLVDQPFIWAGCAVFGLLGVGIGLHRIRTEGHGLKPGSFLWSIGVIAFVAWVLWLGFPQSDFGFHVMRMLLIAWAASNASNIVLQLVEVWRRRPAVRRRRRHPSMQRMQQASRLLHRRRVTTILVEEILPDHVLAAGRSAEGHSGHIAPDLLEHLGDVPLIDLVPHDDGSFIPRDLRKGEAVPVRRRR